jgi:hypothetical protein
VTGSQKELEKALHMDIDSAATLELHKMKARIEIIAVFEDLKVIRVMLAERLKK